MVRITKGQDVPFTQVPNCLLNDEGLSLEAKGLMAWMLSKPDDWKFYVRHVASQLGKGKDTIAKYINELIKRGYIERRARKRSSDGTFEYYEYVLYIEPSPKKPDQENPTLEKPTQEISDNSNKDCINTDCSNKDTIGKAIPYEEIIQYLNKALQLPRGYRATTQKTKRLVKARWNEGFRLADFKKVIDTKVEKWGEDEKMKQYLRPQTLFGTKFEAYLAEWEMKTPNMTMSDEDKDWLEWVKAKA